MHRIDVVVTNQQSALAIDAGQLVDAVRAVLQEAAVTGATVSVAVVDDRAIQALNRRYLAHDDPTDVLSFLLDRTDENLEGEIIVSAETALAQAGRFGWSSLAELLLYVIHGALHLVGYDDATPREQAAMREQERAHLARLGWAVPYEEELSQKRESRRMSKGGKITR